MAGSYDEPNADMLDILATTLGQPDYNLFTSESLDPSATKLVIESWSPAGGLRRVERT